MRQADFERLYAEHAQRLFGFLMYRTGDRTLAEDVMADTFEAAYRARRRFDRRLASERTWLYTIALNRLRDLGRRQAAQERAYERAAVDGGAGGVDPTLDRVEQRDELERGLAGLSEQEREVIALRFAGGLALKEIAATIGEPTSTVEGRLYRGLRRMREAME